MASVRCRSRRPPTRKLTTLQMAVTAITFWRTVEAVLKSLTANSWRTRSMATSRVAVGVRVGLRGSYSVRLFD